MTSRLGRSAILAVTILGASVNAVWCRDASAAPDRVPGQLIVKPRAGSAKSSRAAIAARLGGRVLRELPLIGAQVVEIAPDRTEAALAAAKRDPDVDYAEPNWIVHADVLPNDPQFAEQWSLRNTGQTGGTPGADIRATLAWGVFRGDSNLRIGIIDTGMQLDHPDLAANLWTNPGEIPGNGLDDDSNGYVDDVHGYDVVNGDGDPSDDYFHGTHVAGTIGATGDDGIGVAGIAWACDLVPIKFLDSTGNGTIDGAVLALAYAVRVGVALTNNSWSGGPFSQALHDGIVAAGEANQLFIAAAGNSATNNDAIPVYPASYDIPCIVTVAATDDDDQLAAFSNYGATSVDLGAPGVAILSSTTSNGYSLLSGTSMAAPHVSGVAALLFGQNPGISAADVKQRLLTTAIPIPALTGRCVTGARLDMLGALADPEAVPPGSIGDVAIAEAGSTTLRLQWTATGDDGATGRAALYDFRYSTAPITPGNFDSATPAEAPDPSPSGSQESFELGGLAYNTTYWFALRALDEYLNAGPISNVASGTTFGIPDIDVASGAIAVQLQVGGSTALPLSVANRGTGRLDFTVAVPQVLLPDAQARPRSKRRSGDRAPLAKHVPDTRRGDPVLEGRGGPDALGYRWEDSDEPGGGTFQWIDITAIGTRIPFNNDDQRFNGVPIGFAFPFYGYVRDHVNIITNGFFSFTSTRTLQVNQPLPDDGFAVPENLVAPYWDDLDFTPSAGNSRAYYYSDGARFIVEFVDVPHYIDPAGRGPYTFEAILYRNGEIRFQYLSIGEPNSSATVGIQDYSRTVGLQVAFNSRYARPGLMVRFVPLPQWVLALPPSGASVPAGESRNVLLRFDAAGLHSGDYDALLRILSNDPDENPYEMPVHLHVAGGVSDAAHRDAAGGTLSVAGAHPARGAIRLRLRLTERAQVAPSIYDVRGALVRALPVRGWDAGEHVFEWDGRDGAGRPVAAGSYIVRVYEPSGTRSLRVTMLR